MAVLIVVATCSVLPSAASTPAGGRGDGDPLAGVEVPPAYTPLVLAPVEASTFPFPGTDGKYHVAYDLQLTNASPLPGSLERVDVVDAHDPDTVVASFTGTQLVDPTCAYGDCNRFRLLPSSDAEDTNMAPQESRVLMLDLEFDSLADAPKAVLHHLYGTGQAAPPAEEPTPVDYLAAPFDISAGTPRSIGPPVKGKNWVALNGCCGIGFPHRPSLAPTSGQLNNSQRLAIDWKQMNAAGQFFTGALPPTNEAYVDYGSKIYAVADGTVVATLDEVEAGTPGILPATDPVLAPKITVENVDGNHIVIDIGSGEFAMYAHLIKGSLKVKEGDTVKKGDVIAELGNTGNSNASHMHFQLMDGPSLLYATSLPYVIDRFVYRGQVEPQQIIDTDDFISGSFSQQAPPKGEPRTKELPSMLAIVDFPKK